MGATYTRQSSYTDGDVITAAHTNDEFNQLLAAFQASTGHTHDGTANEGGPITKLLGNTLTFGAGTAGTDITITFDGETSDGVLKWMEDEDYFEFSDDILIASTEKLQFRDTAIYINSSTDGQLDLVADTEIQIAATTIDINGNADVSGTLTYGSLSDGAITITAFVDEDNMASNSATLVPTQQSVKAYVDTQLTAEDLDFQADSGGALSIDLDSETLTFTGGTGIDTSGSGNAVTFAIDSTVATLSGSQTLTNKTLTTPIANAGVQLKNGATSAGFLEFFEDSDNGTNKVTLIGPASTGDVTITLPSTAGTVALTSDIAVTASSTTTFTNKSIDSDNNTITNIVNADIKSSAAIADTKLDTISTAGKVALTALEIDGATDISADLTTSDLIIVDDGAGGTNRKAALSRVVTLMTAQGFTTDDPTALAIALG